ncbi:MAG: sigma-54-dependent transcriptional regulator [bacterium]
MLNYTLLVIDDEKAQLDALVGFFKKKKYSVEKATSGDAGLEIVKAKPIDLILTDFSMPHTNGLAVLKEAKLINPEIEVIVITAFGSIESATEAMKAGALDFLTKPIDLDQLELILEKAFHHKQLVSENRELHKQLEKKFHFTEIISASSEIEKVLNTAARVAATQATILIRGESGTGKELIAKAIHYSSPRKDMPLITVNCAALPENLLESELFGHEKGAFTGAASQRKGRFELAHNGTIFLDEIGEMPLSLQVKLLRVLQEKTFERVGGSKSIEVDVRLITATNRDLEKMLVEKTFREDLYYRINVISITIPALRKRKIDIPLLIDHFIRNYSTAHAKSVREISKEAMDRLLKYSYPGNVRELANIIERSVILARGKIITTQDLPITVQGIVNERPNTYDFSTGTFVERVAAFEKRLIQEAMEKANNVQTKAAKILGMTERHLRYKLNKYGRDDLKKRPNRRKSID